MTDNSMRPLNKLVARFFPEAGMTLENLDRRAARAGAEFLASHDVHLATSILAGASIAGAASFVAGKAMQNNDPLLASLAFAGSLALTSVSAFTVRPTLRAIHAVVPRIVARNQPLALTHG